MNLHRADKCASVTSNAVVGRSTPLETSNANTHLVDNTYASISNIVRLYGIDLNGLDHVYQRSKIEFAHTLINRFHTRDRLKEIVIRTQNEHVPKEDGATLSCVVSNTNKRYASYHLESLTRKPLDVFSNEFVHRFVKDYPTLECVSDTQPEQCDDITLVSSTQETNNVVSLTDTSHSVLPCDHQQDSILGRYDNQGDLFSTFNENPIEDSATYFDGSLDQSDPNHDSLSDKEACVPEKHFNLVTKVAHTQHKRFNNKRKRRSVNEVSTPDVKSPSYVRPILIITDATEDNGGTIQAEIQHQDHLNNDLILGNIPDSATCTYPEESDTVHPKELSVDQLLDSLGSDVQLSYVTAHNVSLEHQSTQCQRVDIAMRNVSDENESQPFASSDALGNHIQLEDGAPFNEQHAEADRYSNMGIGIIDKLECTLNDYNKTEQDCATTVDNDAIPSVLGADSTSDRESLVEFHDDAICRPPVEVDKDIAVNDAIGDNHPPESSHSLFFKDVIDPYGPVTKDTSIELIDNHTNADNEVVLTDNDDTNIASCVVVGIDTISEQTTSPMVEPDPISVGESNDGTVGDTALYEPEIASHDDDGLIDDQSSKEHDLSHESIEAQDGSIGTVEESIQHEESGFLDVPGTSYTEMSSVDASIEDSEVTDRSAPSVSYDHTVICPKAPENDEQSTANLVPHLSSEVKELSPETILQRTEDGTPATASMAEHDTSFPVCYSTNEACEPCMSDTLQKTTNQCVVNPGDNNEHLDVILNSEAMQTEDIQPDIFMNTTGEKVELDNLCANDLQGRDEHYIIHNTNSASIDQDESGDMETTSSANDCTETTTEALTADEPPSDALNLTVAFDGQAVDPGSTDSLGETCYTEPDDLETSCIGVDKRITSYPIHGSPEDAGDGPEYGQVPTPDDCCNEAQGTSITEQKVICATKDVGTLGTNAVDNDVYIDIAPDIADPGEQTTDVELEPGISVKSYALKKARVVTVDAQERSLPVGPMKDALPTVFNPDIVNVISNVEAYRCNRQRPEQLLDKLCVEQFGNITDVILDTMLMYRESMDEPDMHLGFVLTLYLKKCDLNHKRELFLQLTTRLLKAVSDTTCHADVSVLKMLLDEISILISKEFSLDEVLSLVDAAIGLAFRIRGHLEDIGISISRCLSASVYRCHTMEEYNSIIAMVIKRINADALLTWPVSSLLLCIFEQMLSNYSVKNPFHECRTAIHSVLSVSISHNFGFTRSLVNAFMDAVNNITAHVCLRFIVQLLMQYMGDAEWSITVKRRCLKIIQTVATTIFDVYNVVYTECGYLQEYINCFKMNNDGMFNIGIFDISSMEGCMDGEFTPPKGRIDSDSIRQAARQYMVHLGSDLLHNANIRDLVLLLTLKHVANLRFTGYSMRTVHKKRHMNADEISESVFSNAKKYIKSKGTKYNASKKACKGADAAIPLSLRFPKNKSRDLGLKEMSCTDSALGDMDDVDDLVDDSPQSNDTSMSWCYNPDVISDDIMMHYGRITWRLFMATLGRNNDDRIDPDISQYMLLPINRLIHQQDNHVSASCFHLVLYHIYYDTFLAIWKLMSNVIYTSNDYCQLTSASAFIRSTVKRHNDYMSYRVVRRLLIACMGDQCYIVRLSAARLLADVFNSFTPEDIGGDQLLSKVFLSLRDVNWKVRLESIKAILNYIRRRGIDMSSMAAVSAVAERSCDLEKEHPQVRDALLNILSYSIFSKEHPFINETGSMSVGAIEIAERYIKIVLYKISLSKAHDNFIEKLLLHFKSNYKSIEACTDAISKEGLQTLADTQAKCAIEKWMSVLMNLFLLRRNEGASVHVLAEILCVLQLFGQTDPKAFASHVTYFLPYLSCDVDEHIDSSRIDLIVLICNLVSIAAAQTTIPRRVEADALMLVSFDSPALTRAAIQLLVKLGKCSQQIESIFRESYEYLDQLRHLVSSESRNPADVVNLMSYNVLLRSAWKLGCIAEFANLSDIFHENSSITQDLFDLLLTLSDTFYDAGLYNVAGMLVQSVARMLINIKNVLSLSIKGIRSLLRMFDQSSMVTSIMMVLYQLLNVYTRLVKGTDLDIGDHDKADINKCSNEIDACLSIFIDAFVEKIIIASCSINNANLVMSLEICNMIVINRLTNPEPLQGFLFSNVISRDANTQRLAEQVLKTLARNDTEIFLAKLASSLKGLLFSVVIESFSHCMRCPPLHEGRGTHCNCSMEDRTTASKNPDSLVPKDEFILGYGSELTTSRIRGLVRLFLEAVTSTKHVKKVLATIVALLCSSITQDFRDDIEAALGNYRICPDKLRDITVDGNLKLQRLLNKYLNRACKKELNAISYYFVLLFIDMMASILDHLTFRESSVARFLQNRIGSVLKNADSAVPEDIRRYRDSRLNSLYTRMKQLCA
ncbi:uncharacterized protein BBOV_IV003910 [Babesia bovis T2Bo]|uniref:Uncharacterized protein n=1 Tax=Babesia bovis TaxID=5865 RepID=A7AQD3_BABBO|nr:uncharacterized protein BBOV_IV003910 [Babesia bovis T2Bo]EDO06752.1 hypothetical protein BBOV_IV003910 [Babesia bovis T2Bo]|eukprot:XP_001610320.1 hypothetical protein [Babesia bovis T2Bo]